MYPPLLCPFFSPRRRFGGGRGRGAYFEWRGGGGRGKGGKEDFPEYGWQRGFSRNVPEHRDSAEFVGHPARTTEFSRICWTTRAPSGRNCFHPTSFIHRPPLEGCFQGWGGLQISKRVRKPSANLYENKMI